MTLFLMILTHTYLMLWKAMYIHWSLYSLMFTGFEILLLPPYTCLMAFLVQAHFQIAPTFPLNRTLSLMPLGPGLLPLFVHKAGSLREISISFFFFFSFGVLRKNNVFSTSKINRERKKKKALESIKVEISSPSETNQWCCVEETPMS